MERKAFEVGWVETETTFKSNFKKKKKKMMSII